MNTENNLPLKELEERVVVLTAKIEELNSFYNALDDICKGAQSRIEDFTEYRSKLKQIIDSKTKEESKN